MISICLIWFPVWFE